MALASFLLPLRKSLLHVVLLHCISYPKSLLKTISVCISKRNDVVCLLGNNANYVLYVTKPPSETFSEPFQTSKMKFFTKIVDGRKPPLIFAKGSILDVWQGFQYASETLTLLTTPIVNGNKFWKLLNNQQTVDLYSGGERRY